MGGTRFGLAVVLVGALLTGAVGCGGSAPDVQTVSSKSAPGGWRPTAADRRALDQAEVVLAARCLRGHGFSFWVPAPRQDHDWALPYVIDDPAWARAHGYGGARQRQQQAEQKSDPNARYVESLSRARQQAYQDAFFGTNRSALTAPLPDGTELSTGDSGCLAEARRELFGDVRAWFAADSLDLHLDLLVMPRTEADQRYRRSLRQWSRCAGKSDPGALRSATGRLLQGRTPTEADRIERRSAVLEATCAVSSGLGRTARTLDAVYRAQVERRYAGQLTPLRAMQYDALPRARDLSKTTTT